MSFTSSIRLIKYALNKRQKKTIPNIPKIILRTFGSYAINAKKNFRQEETLHSKCDSFRCVLKLIFLLYNRS